MCVCFHGSGYYGFLCQTIDIVLSLGRIISTLWSTRHYLINNLHKRIILALLKSILTTVKVKLSPGHDTQFTRGW